MAEAGQAAKPTCRISRSMQGPSALLDRADTAETESDDNGPSDKWSSPSPKGKPDEPDECGSHGSRVVEAWGSGGAAATTRAGPASPRGVGGSRKASLDVQRERRTTDNANSMDVLPSNSMMERAERTATGEGAYRAAQRAEQRGRTGSMLRESAGSPRDTRSPTFGDSMIAHPSSSMIDHTRSAGMALRKSASYPTNAAANDDDRSEMGSSGGDVEEAADGVQQGRAQRTCSTDVHPSMSFSVSQGAPGSVPSGVPPEDEDPSANYDGSRNHVPGLRGGKGLFRRSPRTAKSSKGGKLSPQEPAPTSRSDDRDVSSRGRFNLFGSLSPRNLAPPLNSKRRLLSLRKAKSASYAGDNHADSGDEAVDLDGKAPREAGGMSED